MIDDNVDFMVVNSAFPHIGKKLKFLWGNFEFNTYIGELIYDTRGGTRAGFSKDVIKSLFSLSLAHELEYPQFIPKQTNVWNFSR